MYGNYGEFAGTEEFMEEFMASLGMSLASSLWSYVLSIAAYIFMAVGMYAIAKRRGIRNAWLAWIPFGSSWMLGCISDQYRYVTMGQEKSKRKVLLGLDIAVSASGTVTIAVLVAAMIKMFGMMDSMQYVDDAAYMTEVLSPLMLSLVLCLVMLGLAIAQMVLRYMALHDLFKSCSPDNATMFLVLGIFLGNILMSLFVFVSRKKDLGMAPPRQNPAVYAQPVFQPQPTVDPWQQPQTPVDPWQQPQTPVDPWQQNNDQT